MKQVFVLFLLLPLWVFCQTNYDHYDDLISEANNLRKNGDYQNAIAKYKSALEILTPNSSTPFFNLADSAIKLNDVELADVWIRKGIAKGGAQMEYLREYKGFSEILNESFYQKIISDYNSLRQQYFSTIDDIDLYLQIEELTARDQFVRKTGLYLDGFSEIDYQNAGDEYMKASQSGDTARINELKKIVFHQDKPEHAKTTTELMRKVDSLNVARLMEITKKHGWQERAWIILWHQRNTYGEDHYVWNFFKPIIDKEIEEGKLSRSFWDNFEMHKQLIGLMKKGDVKSLEVKDKSKKDIENIGTKIKG